MRTIKKGKTFWKIGDDYGDTRVEIYRGKIWMRVTRNYFSADEWSDLCSWIEEKRKEGSLK